MKNHVKSVRSLSLGLVLSLLVSATSAFAADSLAMNGAGATFPYPLYSKWFNEYRKVNPAVEINYQSIGSGGGIRQIVEKTVDFGASDAPMTDEQLAKANPAILHIPTVLGAVVITYNLPGVTTPLKFSPEVLADIFMGKITRWNDPKIAALNAGVALPEKLSVIVARRSDGSGTTAIFTDYLSKISADWKSNVGAGTAVKWPTGLGGKGNEGVTGLIKQTPGAVGYVELIYAESNKLPVALIQNSEGNFVSPTVKSLTASAAAFAKDIPADFRVSLTNAKGKDAYPISGLTYLLVYKKMPAAKANALKSFIGWALKDGQKMAESLSYGTLPKELTERVLATVKGIEAQ